MSFETVLVTGISFNRETFDSKYAIEDAIQEEEALKASIESRLKELAAITEPKKFCSNEDDPLIWLDNVTGEHLMAYGECCVRLFKLNLLLENFDKAYDSNTGMFKKLPECIDEDSAFVYGDFIKNEQ